MGADMTRRGYYSILRWRSDATRDEARNLAVVVVGGEGEYGGIRYAPVGSISPRLHEQGLLDAMLVGLEKQFRGETKPTLATLEQMHASLHRSLYLTDPQPVAVPDVGAVLEALYRAYVAPRPAGRRPTKGVVLDHVVATLRRRGMEVKRGAYIHDFIFDVVLELKGRRRSVMEVLSFATEQKNWAPVEHDAGHFLFALEQLSLKGIAVLYPPSEATRNGASASLFRVRRWLDKARVPALPPGDLAKVDLESLVTSSSASGASSRT